MRVGSPAAALWTGPLQIEAVFVIFFLILLPCFIEIHACSANSVNPAQTPCTAASDLGLHCLPMSLS